MPTVSIIIPIYNVEPYIRQCLQSVMDQTLTEGLECILVDDCGQDKSMDIAQQMVDEYNGNIDFRIIHHETNRGLSAARNAGIRAAKGEYILFVDSDDEITKDAINLLISEAKKHPGIDVVMGATRTDFCQSYYDISCYKDINMPVSGYWVTYNFFKSGKTFAANAWNKLVSRKIIIENNLFFMPGIIHEDNHWMFYILKHIKTFAFVFEETYLHYRNEGSIMATLTPEKEARNWIAIMSDLCDNLYQPFTRLQLLHFLNQYFDKEMCLQRRNGNNILHFKFIRECIKQRLWKMALQLMIWGILFPVRDIGRLRYRLAAHSNNLFVTESQKWRNKLIQKQ